jgi:hypothetical protein
MQLSRLTVNPNNKPQQPERAEIYSYWANAKLSYPDQATELSRKVVFYTDRKSEQNRRVAARGWLQRLVRLYRIGNEAKTLKLRYRIQKVE